MYWSEQVLLVLGQRTSAHREDWYSMKIFQQYQLRVVDTSGTGSAYPSGVFFLVGYLLLSSVL
jgi:hypothetical protein